MTKRTSKFSKLLTEWVQIFAAGTHTDSNGVERPWTTAELDEMVSNHNANDLAPMVIGHPKHDSPAWGWIGGLKREGEALFAKFDNVHPKFIEWGEAGHIRNRSVKILKTPKGFRVGHIGFLGAMAPAVEGMQALEFAADAEGDTYEFGWQEGYRLGLVARLFRRLRDRTLATDGQEAADNLVPAYEIEELERAAADSRAEPEAPLRPNTFNTPPNPETDMPFSQQQLDDAVTAAVNKARKEEQDRHQVKERASQYTANLATNRAFISSLISDDKGNVRLTPAQAEGWAEALAFAQGLEGAEFTFSAADKSEQKPQLFEFLKGKLEQLVPQLKLGQVQADKDVQAASAHAFSAPADVAIDQDRLALHGRAKEYQATHAGTTYLEAVRAVGG